MFEKRLSNEAIEEQESPALRRQFVIKVYTQFLICVAIGIVHWLLAVTLLQSTLSDLIKEHASTFVLLFIISVFLFILYALTDQVSEIPCISCVVIVLIVECLNLAVLVLVVNSSALHLLVGILGVMVVVIILCVLGTFMPFDITDSVNFFFMVACSVFLLSIYAIMYYVALKTTWPIFFYIAIIASLVLSFLLYHVQCIAGDGRVQAGLGDDKYASLLLYHDFLALFMLTLYWQ
ncbi:uncharacterized protein [Drosophila tropicalis]|uniref:uncharacterized protein n=1 Tax=Drosophila tropicalis TaxID=46794 RepID=UPI0035AC2818